jgi:FtsH-binding integral membrane protein
MGLYSPGYQGAYAPSQQINMAEVMRRVYWWLFLGLAVGFGIAYTLGSMLAASRTTDTFNGIISTIFNPISMIVLFVAYLGVAFGFYPIVQRASFAVGATLYLVFTAIFGLLISTIFVTYTSAEIWSAFAATAGMFGVMSLIGFTTKLDLSKLGAILFMGLIGIIIASIVNIFLHSAAIYWIVTYAAVVIFCGFTAYDTQWIRRNATSVVASGDANAAGRIALVGAFRLFLDFVNLFLSLLRIFGGRR